MGQEKLRAKTWRDALHAYATELESWLSSDLSLLARSGLKMASSHRIALTLSEGTTFRQRDGHKSYESEPLERTIIEDLKGFSDWWSKGDTRPLLLLAPFGAGKSTLLAAFACLLTKQVRHWCKQPQGKLPPIPMPVRLRDWKWGENCNFCDYIRTDAQKHLNPFSTSILSPYQINVLAREGLLLPLYDGLDELAESIRSMAIIGMGRLGGRFIGVRSANGTC